MLNSKEKNKLVNLDFILDFLYSLELNITLLLRMEQLVFPQLPSLDSSISDTFDLLKVFSV